MDHLSIANTRCRSVWTKDHSSSTDSCSVSSGSACARAIVFAHSSSRAAHPARMASGLEGRSIARSGYHGSRSFTYAVTSTPLMTTVSTSASMSTLTSHAWLIFTSVRFTSRKRAPLRSAPQNTAPARSPSNSSGVLPPVASLPFSVQLQVCRSAALLSSGATKSSSRGSTRRTVPLWRVLAPAGQSSAMTPATGPSQLPRAAARRAHREAAAHTGSPRRRW